MPPLSRHHGVKFSNSYILPRKNNGISSRYLIKITERYRFQRLSKRRIFHSKIIDGVMLAVVDRPTLDQAGKNLVAMWGISHATHSTVYFVVLSLVLSLLQRRSLNQPADVCAVDRQRRHADHGGRRSGISSFFVRRQRCANAE